MADTNLQVLLLEDAVARVHANPGESRNWHQLFAALNTCTVTAALERAVRQVMPIAEQNDVAAFLCATMLAIATGDPAWDVRAGELAGTIQPYDPERVLTFCHVQWSFATRDGASRTGFTGRLRAAGLPRLMRQAGQWLARHTVLPEYRPVLRASRIAIVAPFIGHDQHPPTNMALQQAAVLDAAGITTHVFSAQEALISRMEDYSGAEVRIHHAPAELATLGSRLPASVGATVAQGQFGLPRRWRDIGAAIARFDPDLVLFVGLYSPLADALYPVRPVVGLSVHSTQPLAAADVWLAADPTRAGHEESEWGSDLPPAWGHHHPFRASEKAAPPVRPEREAGQTVLLTVGARLEQEIAGAWAEGMVALLADYPSLRWLLVGGRGRLPPALAGVPPHQIRCVAHATNIGELYAQADIYVNPPRVGGGLSVAEAMAASVPVVSLADGDGGSKLGPLAAPEPETYFAQLRQLVTDAGARAEAGAAARARFVTILDVGASGPSLLAACASAIERFAARTALSRASS